MQFSSFNEFLAMGGYGFYVWLSYGACVIVMFGILIASRWSHCNTLNQIKAQMAREERIKKAKGIEALNPRRKKRLFTIAALFTGLSLAVALTLISINENIDIFYTPTELIEGKGEEKQNRL